VPKKPEEPKKEEAPEWIVSFTDMTSLEMAFFICLMSFSTPRKEKLAEVQGSIQSAFGLLGKAPPQESRVTQEGALQGRDPTNTIAPKETPRYLPLEEHEPKREILRLRDQLGQEIDIDRIVEGYRLRVGNAVMYKRGEIEVPGLATHVVAKLADAVRTAPFRIVVVGYATSREIPGEASDERVVELALRRATAICEYLVREQQLASERLAVAGYSDGERDAVGRVEFILADEVRFLRGAP
jgi:chemotaxis protein MotB